MPNELIVRQDGIGGLIEDNPLTAAATTLTSAGLAALQVIGTTNFAWVILDPDGEDGAPEHVKITAHTAGATTATILRGQNGTTAREHLAGVRWVHGPVAADFNRSRSRLIVTSGSRTFPSAWGALTPEVDAAIAAGAGDWIMVALSGFHSFASSQRWLDMVTWVSGAPVSYVGGGAGGAAYEGVGAWAHKSVSSSISPPPGGMVLYQVGAADLSGGLVTFRLFGRGGGSMPVSADQPLIVSLINMGTA